MQKSKMWLGLSLLVFLQAWMVNLYAAQSAFPQVYYQTSETGFPLVAQGVVANLYVDAQDYQVVQITADMLVHDIELVTGQKSFVRSARHLKEISEVPSVVVGTIGQSRLIDEMIRENLIQPHSIQGKWESYMVTTVLHPRHQKPLLVIAGSDRRGTAFGVTSLCQAIGVSPWYWWADVTPQKRSSLYVQSGTYFHGEPSVQYRGIFINDERFGGWAKWVETNFDKESGEVGPKVYKKVFELLLRLKGNYLWPAMHNGSKAFNANPENARLADDYAIVMGSSHCEQMLRNNEDEWKNVGTYGDFNYITNRKTMIDYWEARVKSNGQYENTYTLGLRGIHDYPMEGAQTTQERVALMQQAIYDQRDMLKRNISKPLEEIPQVLCTYEEVLDAYHNGLKVPDDVTLLWCDDKHGFTRNLCNPSEMKRSGGAGIYYHLSYHGDPASWIWLSPLSPSLIANELTKAYTFGVRKIWVFNVGDIKPAEKEISFAMDLAWDIKQWTPENAHTYMRHWASQTFGSDFADEISDLQEQYYRLQAAGKDSHVYFVQYSEQEIENRIGEFRRLSDRAQALAEHIPSTLKDAYFELILYPIKGAAMLNEYQLLSRRSLVHAAYADGAGALRDAQQTEQMFNALNEWTREYHEIRQGKWNNFFCWVPYHWYDAKEKLAPIATTQMMERVKAAPAARFLSVQEALSKQGVCVEALQDCEIPLWIEALTPTHNFSKKREDNLFCTVHIGKTSFEAAATPINNIWHAPFVGPMWSKVGVLNLKKGINRLHISQVKVGARIDSLFIGIHPPFPLAARQIIPANHYTKLSHAAEGMLKVIPGLGYQDGLEVQPFDTPSYDLDQLEKAPHATYELNLHPGKNKIEIRTLPTLRVHEGREARYAVAVEHQNPQLFSIHAQDFSAEWRWNVLRGYATRTMEVEVDQAGIYLLDFYFMDPGIVLQEIRILP